MEEDFERQNKKDNCSSVIVLNTNVKKRFDKNKNKYFLRVKWHFKVHAVVTNLQAMRMILFLWIQIFEHVICINYKKQPWGRATCFFIF